MKKTFLLKLLILSLTLSASLLAQTNVHLHIMDENQENLIGTSILLQGTTIGTVSDIDGTATLEINTQQEEITLIFSYSGFPEKHLKINMNEYNEQVIDVVLRKKPLTETEKIEIRKTQSYINNITIESFLKRARTKAAIKRKATFLNKTKDSHKFENRAVEVTIFNLDDEVSLFTLNRIPQEVKDNPDMYAVAWEGYTNAIENLMDTPESQSMRDEFGPNLKPRFSWIIEKGVNTTSILREAIHTANLGNCKIKSKEIFDLANTTFEELKNDINYQVENIDLILKPYTAEHPYSEPLGIKATYTFTQGQHEDKLFDVYYAYNKESEELILQRDMACFEIIDFLSH